MSSLQDLIAQLPPGTDVYAVVQNLYTDAIYPELPRAFWIQGWIGMGLLGLIILCILSGFIIRWRMGRLILWIRDGPLSRPSHTALVPACWLVNAACQIILFAMLRHAMVEKAYTVHIGRFWWTANMPLVTSYLFLSVTILCHSPRFRMLVVRQNRGRITIVIFNLLWCLCAGICLSLALGVVGIREGKYFAELASLHDQLVAVIANAKEQQNLALLAGIEPIQLKLSLTNDYSITRLGGILYSSWVGIFLLTAIFPAIQMSNHIKKTISKLESEAAARPSTFSVALRPTPAPMRISLDVPKDAPFANIIDMEAAATPQQFQRIIQSRDTASVKAQRLREELKQSYYQTVAYTFLLIFYSGITLFQSFDGPRRVGLSQKQSSMQAQSWIMWNFLLPGVAVAAFYFKSAFKPELADINLVVKENHEMPVMKHGVAEIRLHQEVQISADISDDTDDKNSMKRVNSLHSLA